MALMRPLFSPAGRKALAQLPKDKTLIAFDFDGTLAPIVTDPEDAFTLPEFLPVLRRLAEQSRTAVISGRARNDVRRRMLFKPDAVVGNHGMEGLPEFAAKGAKAKAVCRKWVAQLKRDLRELPANHGLFVEDKKHSLSLHYRQAKKPAIHWLSDEVENLWPQPRVIPGHMLFNVVPTGSPHKGMALKVLMKRYRCTHAVFIGDDDTDEDAFGISPKVLSIRVGRKRGSRAEFYIRRQDELLEVLKQLLKS